MPTPFNRPAALEGLRVLVVDDNQTNRRILEEMLDSWHMKPMAVSDSTTAMAALRKAPTKQPFHVVITDCQMPDVDGFALAHRIKADQRFRATPIIMLTSIGRPEDTDRCRRMGVEACLTKPVKHSDLLEMLASVVGVSMERRGMAAREDGQGSGAASEAVATAAPRRLLRVLVAEDNVVNRKLVATILDKRGHQVRAVDNGREAVAALAGAGRDSFDVVLMDVQMPEMGGFEATQAIRAAEPAGAARLPIIALTAHAMQGDRERCLEAGMDDYLPKPIDVNELIAAVERHAGQTSRPRSRPAAESQPDAVFDEKAALAHTGGDRRLLKEIIAMFRADYPASIRRIRRAIHQRDGEALRMAAHGLKGSIATVGSPAGQRAALELEHMGRTNEFTHAEAAYTNFRRQLTMLERAFAAAKLVAKPRKRRRS